MTRQEIDTDQAKSVLQTVYNVFDAWGLSETEQMSILGISNLSYAQFRNPDFIQVDTNMIERLSYILGIYKNLQILLPDTKSADSWVNRPNTAKLFNGKPPLVRLVTGDLDDLHQVRQFLDSMGHGNS